MKNISVFVHIELFLFLCFFASLTPAQAQWSQTKGPLGQHFFEMLQHGDRIWGASIGGLYYSDNEGEFWNHHPAFSYDDYVYSIGKYKGELFAVVERGGAENTAPFEMSLLRSSDDGMSWQLVGGLPLIGVLDQVSVHEGELILTGGVKPYFSVDDGANWQRIPLPLPDSDSPMYAFDTTTFVVWYNQKGIFASQDIGQSWTTVADSAAAFEWVSGVRGHEIIARKRVQAPVNVEHYYTQNLGQTWALLSDPFPDTTLGTSYTFWRTDTILASNPAYKGQYQISVNGGTDWQLWTEWGTEGFLPKIITSDGALSGTTKFYLATGTTEIRNEGLINANARDIKSNNNTLFVNTNDHFYSSKDYGNTWEHLPLDIRVNRGQLEVVGDTLYTCEAHNVLVATNGGLSGWDTLCTVSLFGLSEMRVFGNHIVLYTSEGISIVNRHTGQVKTLNTPTDGGTLLILGSRFVFSDNFDAIVWISENEGQSWTKTLNGNDTGCRMLYVNDGLMLCTKTTTFHSADKGSTWTNIGSVGLPFNPLGWGGNALPGEAIGIGTVIYASFPDYGVYKTEDWGANWEAFNGGLGALRNNGIAMQNGQIFLATPTSGVWHNPLTINAVSTLFEAQKLLLAPNPSAGQFILHLPDGTPADLRCFDALGKQLWQKNVPGGPTLLDLGNCPEGVYQLVAVSASKTYKASVVLQK